MIDFDKYAKEIYEQNKAVGWWDDPNRNVLETLQLVSTEIAEATEGERKDLMDDHLPHRKMGEVELADALIRMLDIGGRCGWVVPDRPQAVSLTYCFIESQAANGTPVGGLHCLLTKLVGDLAGECEPSWGFDELAGDERSNAIYATFLISTVAVAELQGYDIEGAMIEKLEYNRHRADHRRENRAKTDGKKF